MTTPSHTRSIWRAPGARAVEAIDQTQLPHRLATARLESAEAVVDAIKRMVVRGAPLIGATGAYGLAMALDRDASDDGLARARAALLAARPTAVNLRWALDRARDAVAGLAPGARADAAFAFADALCDEDVATNEAIAVHGAQLIRAVWEREGKGRPVEVLTHCHTGRLACVDWGTALGAIRKAHETGVPVHVWVDETRPRNQGASLTAWELGEHGVACTLIADNAGGHLMQRGRVDLCLVGADRVTAAGDVANKIGTYLKALAAKASGVPFHVAIPSSTIDWSMDDGLAIEIEERAADEVTHMTGVAPDGSVTRVRITPEGVRAANPAFDVTPAALVTSLVTERGVCAATREGLLSLFPERGT
jgi:methylthioribose-1-phosphate isomerase